MKQAKKIIWDLDLLSSSMGISKNCVEEYFKDGRRASFLFERVVAANMGGKITENEGTKFDFFCKDGLKWEVKCITKYGVKFQPSHMIGKGRRYNEREFLNRISNIEGFVVADVTSFPICKYWLIKSSKIKKEFRGKVPQMNYKKTIEFLS